MRTDCIDVEASDTAPDADAPLPLDAPRGDTGGPPPPSTMTPALHAKIPGTEVSPRQVKPLAPPTLADRHRDMISRVDERIRKRASDVVANACLADRVLDEDTTKWTARQRRTAMDARLNNREAPVYLGMAAKLLDSYKRAEATRPPVSPELHADIKVYVRQELTVTYRTMELEDKE